MANIEKFCATGVFDPATYSQGVKVRRRRPSCFSPGRSPTRRMAVRLVEATSAGKGAYAIKALVESQGGTMANVIKITTYVTDMRYRVDLAPIREEFLGKKGPASTLVEISALAHPDWMIEIEAVAVI